MVIVIGVGCGKPGSESSGAPQQQPGAASTTGTVSTIQQKLTADKGLAGADIKAAEQGGSILLEGTVTNQEQKDSAEKIVLDTQKELHQNPAVLNNLMLKENSTESGGKSGG